jgi:hypothetical protein
MVVISQPGYSARARKLLSSLLLSLILVPRTANASPDFTNGQPRRQTGILWF